MFIIPKDGMKIVDPQRVDVLPPEGRDVGDQHPEFWLRRVADGDATVVAPDQEAAARDRLDIADRKRAADLRDAAEAAFKKANADKEPAKPAPDAAAQPAAKK